MNQDDEIPPLRWWQALGWIVGFALVLAGVIVAVESVARGWG